MATQEMKSMSAMEQMKPHAEEPVQPVEEPASAVELSVVIPIAERYDDLGQIHAQHSAELRHLGLSHEFIFVVDGSMKSALGQLEPLKREHPEIQLLAMNRTFGEATALSVGLERARGRRILTLPAYFQVEPAELRHMMEQAADSDLAIAWRYPRVDSVLNRIQTWFFHRITRLLTGTKYHDIACGMRVMDRKVAREVHLYGDLHRFFPLLAYQRGFRVTEVQVRQSRHDAGRRIYSLGIYLRRMLDILTLFFLFKFTKKPLRFFGLVGSALLASGGAISLYLGLYRLFGAGAIGNRPLLILGVLLIVLGLQLFSIGLLGEIIIFTHARNAKDYEVQEIE